LELLILSGGDPSIPNANGQLAAELCDDTDIHLLLLRDRSLLSASKVLRDFQEEPLLEKSPTKVAVAAAAGAGTRSSLDEPAGIRTPTKLSPSMPPTNPDATSNRGHPVSQTYQLQAPQQHIRILSFIARTSSEQFYDGVSSAQSSTPRQQR
jgi:hypothetical protein